MAMVNPEDQKVYIATVEVKNYKPEEITFKVENGKIALHGKHSVKGEFGWETSEFHRYYTLPQGVDPKTITSRIADGVMYIEGFKLPPDAKKDDKKFDMTLDVRGFNPDDVKVSVLNNMLTIEARQESESDGHYMSREFYRHFTLPRDVDMESLQTTLGKDGKLRIEGKRLPQLPPPPTLRQLAIRKD